MRLLRTIENDGDEPRVALLIVEITVDDAAFPEHAAALVGRDLPFDAVEIGLRADHDHEFRVFWPKLLLAPPRPALGRAGLVLIQLGVDAVLAKLIGEPQHPLRVLFAVVAVADEGPGRHRR